MRQRIGLDNPTFAGRIRSYQPRAVLVGTAVGSSYRRAKTMSDVKSVAAKPTVKRAKPKAQPVKLRQMRSKVLMRTNVKKVSIKVRRRSRISLRQSIISVAAMLLFVSGAVINFQSWHTNQQAVEQVKALTGNVEGAVDGGEGSADDGSADIPSEEPISPQAIQRYSVAPDMPKRIIIEKFGVKARILPMSIKANGELKAPGSIYDAGWYSASAKPGDAGGAMLLDGHVSGPTQKGVFHRIKDLEVGDKIIVERGDGQIFTYAVKEKQQTATEDVDMTKLLIPVSQKPGLNLITCGGKFDAKKNAYLDRVVVYTEQI